MICKEKDAVQTQSARIKAASEYEQSVAYFLSQEYKDQSDILIFNDLVLSFDKESCHIDHLVVYRYGFIVIESKSITDEVKINALGDWLQNKNRQWVKMQSPIKTIETQQKILKLVMSANASSILGKLIFHNAHLEFETRSWDQLCAYRSEQNINLDGVSESIKGKILKADSIVAQCKALMKLPTGILDSASKFLDSRPSFKAAEIENIRKFLLEADKSCRSMNKQSNSKPSVANPIELQIPKTTETIKPSVASLKIKEASFKKESTFQKDNGTQKDSSTQKVTISQKDSGAQKVNPLQEIKKENPEPVQVKAVNKAGVDHLITCKKCNQKTHLEGKWGKYGYYVFCSKCDCNTSMKVACPACQSKNVKNRKEKENYYVVCLECEKEHLVFEDQQQSIL